MSDLDDIINELGDLGQDLPNDINDIIRQVLSNEVQKWRTRAPEDTGALKQSISLQMMDPYTWGISFLDYGLYQNFGVRGVTSDPGVFATQNPSFGTPYQFKSQVVGGSLPFAARKTIAQRGLKPQPWFLLPGESLDLLTDRLAQEVERQLTLL